MAEQKLPQRFGRYEVTSLLGAGGMGVVLAARDPQLGRQVAVKVMPPRLKAAPTIAERFRREALSLARLSHPNIVRVFDAGEEGGTLYYVMELLPGTALDRRTRNKEGDRIQAPPFDSQEFLDTFRPLADALATVHAAGIIHRDIKPANIFGGVPERGAVLTDFGLTFLESDDEKLTQEGMIMGTGNFMAPEQVLGKPPDVLCDIYSFGAAMYEFATGRIPFENIPGPSLLAARIVAELTPVREVCPEVPESIASVIDACVKLRSEDRYQAARDVHRALSRAERSLGAIAAADPVSASPPSSASRKSVAVSRARPVAPTVALPSPEPVSQTSTTKLAVVVLLIAAAAGVGFGLWTRQNAPRPGPLPVAVQTARPQPPPAAPAPPKESWPVAARLTSWSKPVELTTAEQPGRRVAAAVGADGTVLAAWTRGDGSIELRAGRENGRLWLIPPASGKLRVEPLSELAMLGRAGAFYLLFAAPGPDKTAWAHVARIDAALMEWMKPVPLGPMSQAGGQLFLTGSSMSSRADPMLAIWEGPPGRSPSVAWGSAASGTWSKTAWPSGGPRAFQRVTGAVGLGDTGLVLWTDVDQEEDSTLMAMRSGGPGQPWSEPEKPQMEMSGYNVRGPIAASNGERIYLLWSENRVTSHPLLLSTSVDGGKSFRLAGRPVFFHCKDTRTGLAVNGDRVWCAWYAGIYDQLSFRTSVDGGKSWGRETKIESTTKPDAVPTLVAGISGEAWYAWSSPSGQVKVIRLP